MCDLLDCKDCRHKCNNDATDNEIEMLWCELEDVPVYEDEDHCLCLDIDWNGWYKGTDVEIVWHWFDEHHSKGVGWLMNEYHGYDDYY